MGVAEALSQYSNARKGRVTTNDDFPSGARVNVQSVAAIHRSRFAGVYGATPDVEPYFVDAEKAKQLVEANEVILLRDIHGKPTLVTRVCANTTATISSSAKTVSDAHLRESR